MKTFAFCLLCLFCLQGTARADYLKLDEMGMLGVTHMRMLDSRSNDIADVMIEWVGKNVRSAPRRR